MWRVLRERRDLIEEMEMLAAASAFNDAYSDDSEDDILEEAMVRSFVVRFVLEAEQQLDGIVEHPRMLRYDVPDDYFLGVDPTARNVSALLSNLESHARIPFVPRGRNFQMSRGVAGESTSLARCLTSPRHPRTRPTMSWHPCTSLDQLYRRARRPLAAAAALATALSAHTAVRRVHGCWRAWFAGYFIAPLRAAGTTSAKAGMCTLVVTVSPLVRRRAERSTAAI